MQPEQRFCVQVLGEENSGRRFVSSFEMVAESFGAASRSFGYRYVKAPVRVGGEEGMRGVVVTDVLAFSGFRDLMTVLRQINDPTWVNSYVIVFCVCSRSSFERAVASVDLVTRAEKMPKVRGDPEPAFVNHPAIMLVGNRFRELQEQQDRVVTMEEAEEFARGLPFCLVSEMGVYEEGVPKGHLLTELLEMSLLAHFEEQMNAVCRNAVVAWLLLRNRKNKVLLHKDLFQLIGKMVYATRRDVIWLKTVKKASASNKKCTIC